MQPTTHRKRPLSPERLSNIDSALAQVERIIAEMSHDADSSGQHYKHTAALKHACALVDPPSSTQHLLSLSVAVQQVSLR